MSRRSLPEPGPGVVKVRLSGGLADLVRVTGMLTGAGAEVLDTHGPRPNRYDPGVRVHLTVRIQASRPASGEEKTDG